MSATAAVDDASSPTRNVSYTSSPALKLNLVCIAPQGSSPPPMRPERRRESSKVRPSRLLVADELKHAKHDILMDPFLGVR